MDAYPSTLPGYVVTVDHAGAGMISTAEWFLTQSDATDRWRTLSDAAPGRRIRVYGVVVKAGWSEQTLSEWITDTFLGAADGPGRLVAEWVPA